MATTYTPLRYPGGKSSIAPFLEQVIDLNGIRGGVYVEPYAGGAGAALRLLFENVVDRIVINDLDPCVAAFWNAVLNDTDRFLCQIESVPLDIDEWYNQKRVLDSWRKHEPFDVGFATFYLNRCNYSGILKAGPIGGKKQSGKYKLHVRFNHGVLMDKVLRIAMCREKIEVHNLDALELLRDVVPAIDSPTLVYLDPPYYDKGSQLYLNAYEHDDHANLANLLPQVGDSAHWVMTYDDAREIRELYEVNWVGTYSLNYFAHHAKQGNELVIAPPNVILPEQVDVAYGVN
ncbi:DNA adenine methylase [Pseudodesulfovibrio thermohalotolerans]|uniref:DNA adenine methylase n=1 Tax=Pseudodesulfovibrio thermohalotolerans TaxID=2880651 RepID=UPI002442E331|nr:DNA adenine methylase [Pseudodesulfovibrio thermohalotolerans]WFS62318.1 DNA adenine methylase [Pseudodesulfovibrio thermohalotolerans]